MPRLYKNFVQIGRVVQVHKGESAGNLAVVLDVVDQSRLLLEGPKVSRGVVKTADVNLTPQVVKITRGLNSKALRKAFDEAKVQEKYAASSVGQRLNRRTVRQNLTDFERHQVLVQRRNRNNKLFSALKKLKAAHNKDAKPENKVSGGRF